MTESDDDWAIFRHLKDAKKEMRAIYGRPCPVCQQRRPRANPSLLLPRQSCKVDGYQDMRPRLSDEEVNAVLSKFGLKRQAYKPVTRKDRP